MPLMLRAFTVSIAAAAILTGCGGTATTATTTTVTVTKTAPAAQTAVAAAAATVGQPQTGEGGVRATPITFEYPATRTPDNPNYNATGAASWAVLDAELGAGNRPINKTGYGFTLVDASHVEYKSHDYMTQQVVPAFSGTGTLAPGECARGLVTFDLPANAAITTIRWEYPGDGGPLRWALH